MNESSNITSYYTFILMLALFLPVVGEFTPTTVLLLDDGKVYTFSLLLLFPKLTILIFKL